MPTENTPGPSLNDWSEIRNSLLLVWLFIVILLVRTSSGSTLDIALLVLALSVLGTLVLPAAPRKPHDAGNLPQLSDRCREIARDPKRKIEAIKVYRDETGLGLRDSKFAVEAFMASEANPSSP